MESNIIIAILSLLICFFIWKRKNSELLKEVAIHFVSALFPFLFVVSIFFIFFKSIDKDTLDFDLFSFLLLGSLVFCVIYRIIKNQLKK